MMRVGRPRAVLTALLVASALAVAGCGTEGSSSAAPEEPGKAAADSKDSGKDDAQKEDSSEEDSGKDAGAAKAAPASLKFSGTTLDGKQFKGESLADKPTVLWFWAPWCSTCQAQAAKTAKLADEYKGKVNFVGVAGLAKTDPCQGFVKTQKVGNFPHLNDQKGSVWKKFGVTQQSTYVMLDKDGKKVHEGSSSPDELGEVVSGLAG